MPRRTIIPQRGKKSLLSALRKGKKKRGKRPIPLSDTGPSAGQGYSGYQGPKPPWGGNEGGRVETEDQRSKRVEKEDANVRGYFHGGGVGEYIKPLTPPVPKRKERGYGQAQEGGTGLSGGGKVKKYGGGGKVKKK